MIQYIEGFLTSNRSKLTLELASNIKSIPIIISVLDGSLKNKFGIQYYLFAEIVRCCLITLRLFDIKKLNNNQIKNIISAVNPYIKDNCPSIKEEAVFVLEKFKQLIERN